MKSESKVQEKRRSNRFVISSRILRDPEKGWFEKEKDNVRVTKYYRTQKEAIEAAKTHVNDLQDKPEGLDVSVLPTGSVAGSPVALHPYG